MQCSTSLACHRRGPAELAKARGAKEARKRRLRHSLQRAFCAKTLLAASIWVMARLTGMPYVMITNEVCLNKSRPRLLGKERQRVSRALFPTTRSGWRQIYRPSDDLSLASTAPEPPQPHRRSAHLAPKRRIGDFVISHSRSQLATYFCHSQMRL
jgi:hypothetical protein